MTTTVQTSYAAIERRPFSLLDLYPPVRRDFERLIAAAHVRKFTITRNGETFQCSFEPFEGLRLPDRQDYLRTVMKTTKAGPWQSAHQYGLAVDFAVVSYLRRGKTIWSWDDDAPWGDLRDLARTYALDIPISWDKGHVQHPMFDEMRIALRLPWAR